MRERGMYWGDLMRLIDRNKSSNAFITYYRDRETSPDKIAIFDRNRLRRKPDLEVETGHHQEDHWRDSHVCEAAFFNGEIPMEGSLGTHNGDEFVEKPYRGALATLQMLLSEGCLRKTDELRDLFARHGRRI